VSRPSWKTIASFSGTGTTSYKLLSSATLPLQWIFGPQEKRPSDDLPIKETPEEAHEFAHPSATFPFLTRFLAQGRLTGKSCSRRCSSPRGVSWRPASRSVPEVLKQRPSLSFPVVRPRPAASSVELGAGPFGPLPPEDIVNPFLRLPLVHSK